MFYLGFDGGGTKCRARLEDAAGRVIAVAESGAANVATDRVGALASILAATESVLAGQCAAQDVVAGLGLAGASLAGPRTWLAERLPFKSARIVQDVETSLIGALGEEDGILAAIGTGSVFASQRAGRSHVIGGWGLRLGDEGSGAWIGRALCRRALRSVDGFVPQTPVLAALLDRIGGPQGMVSFAAQAAPSDFAAFAPDVIAGAKAGDQAALAVFEAASAEVAAAISLLQSGGAALPVVFLGGLGAVFAEGMAARWTLADPKGTALDGAVMLARRSADAVKSR